MASSIRTENGQGRLSTNGLLKPLAMTAAVFTLLLLFSGVASAQADWPRVVNSADGTPISYEVYGEGELTLIFVHGWCCDARYWRNQVEPFSQDYRVVVLDLAGHGHSGSGRTTYSMHSFGEDVVAVAEAVSASPCILIGHSMGGVVIAQAARLMPGQVIGLIGVDTLQNVEYPLTQEEFDQMSAPLRENFRAGFKSFVRSMFRADTDPGVRDWILDDMPAAPSQVALSALEEMMGLYITGEMAAMFEEIHVPVVAVNADMWPIDAEANRRHMHSFDAIVLKDTDHFLMLNSPEEFNSALEDAIDMIKQKQKD